MSPLKTSVLLPSYRRPSTVANCLDGLAAQSVLPDEVIVVWQGDDAETRDAAEAASRELPLRVLHSAEVGVVPAENVALAEASGDVVLLIDDDAVAPTDWIERHLRHYADPTVGAVGGPADNFRPDGTPFPRRAVEPVGRVTWYGRTIGNMYDQPHAWRQRAPTEVHHLVGYNMSLRRTAIGTFESRLRPYWQQFELDACFQVRHNGYRVLFDFGIVVNHYPTNPVYTAGRGGDLQVKIYNAAHNRAFVLAKHSPPMLRSIRLLYLLAVGSVSTPGLLASFVATARHGRLFRELGILWRTWRHDLAGWRGGTRVRRTV